ncbi:response regulator [Maribacter sp. 2-571]|uniref:response regulator n=1 Tax=Maribacter sp. 2-571 TaxID=3417569 RepID=UPI003D34B2D4
MLTKKKSKTDKVPTLFLIDDHVIIRSGLKSIFDSSADYQVIGEAKDGLDSVNKIKTLKPDIVITDLEMPNLSGLDVIRKFRKLNYPTKFVIYCNYLSESDYNKAVALKIDGLLLKEGLWRETMVCLQHIQNGKQYISKACKSVFHRIENFGISNHRKGAILSKLTNKEAKILKLISEQKTTKEIAGLLFKSPKTVENVRYSICRKMKISGQNSLTIFAIKNRNIFA